MPATAGGAFQAGPNSDVVSRRMYLPFPAVSAPPAPIVSPLSGAARLGCRTGVGGARGKGVTDGDGAGGPDGGPAGDGGSGAAAGAAERRGSSATRLNGREGATHPPSKSASSGMSGRGSERGMWMRQPSSPRGKRSTKCSGSKARLVSSTLCSVPSPREHAFRDGRHLKRDRGGLEQAVHLGELRQRNLEHVLRGASEHARDSRAQQVAVPCFLSVVARRAQRRIEQAHIGIGPLHATQHGRRWRQIRSAPHGLSTKGG